MDLEKSLDLERKMMGGHPPHPNFPQGDVLRALVKTRETLYEAGKEAGFKGAGRGLGVADGDDLGVATIDLVVDGIAMEIRILAKRPRQPS